MAGMRLTPSAHSPGVGTWHKSGQSGELELTHAYYFSVTLSCENAVPILLLHKESRLGKGVQQNDASKKERDRKQEPDDTEL